MATSTTENSIVDIMMSTNPISTSLEDFSATVPFSVLSSWVEKATNPTPPENKQTAPKKRVQRQRSVSFEGGETAEQKKKRMALADFFLQDARTRDFLQEEIDKHTTEVQP